MSDRYLDPRDPRFVPRRHARPPRREHEGPRGYWSTSQVAAFFDISENTVRNYAIRGLLPHIRVGHYYWFRPEDVHRCADVWEKEDRYSRD